MKPLYSQTEATPDQHPDLFRAFEPTQGNYHTKYPSYWSPYKTAEEKLRYQKRLPTEIQPFVREYFKKHMGELLSHQSESLLEYLNHTTDAWSKHIEVNRQIDCFLSYEQKNVFGDWSPDEWKLAKRLLIAGMETDHVKTMYSGGIKRKLDAEAAKLIKKYEPADPEFPAELTIPSFATFYLAWELDHLKYLLQVLEGTPCAELKKQLISKYHSGDEGVFNHRLSEMMEKNVRLDREKLRPRIEMMEALCRKNALRKIYSVMERQDVRDFEELLKFDNTTEYEYTYSLKGLPDLFLREEIHRRLAEKGKIDPNRSVFSFSLSEFVVLIDEHINELESHFTIRLREYRQNYDTCGTACIMSILSRRGLQLNEETELRIWEMVGRPYNFPGGLADVLLRNKFNVTYVQNWPEILNRQNPEFHSMSEELLESAKTYINLFEQAIDRGLRFQVEDWDYKKVRSEIKRGNPCIVYLHVTDTMTHVVLAHGIKGDRLKITDPLGHIKYMSEDEFNRRIRNPMGKRLLVVNKLPDDFFTVIGRGLSEIGY